MGKWIKKQVIMKKLNTSLGEFDIQVSKDTDVPNPEVIGFFIPLSQVKNLIIKALTGKNTDKLKEEIKRGKTIKVTSYHTR